MSNARRSVALGVVALTLAIAYGVWYSYSVILVALLEEFGWSRSVLAGAFSVFTLVHGGLNPWIGAICSRLGAARVMTVGGAAMGLSLAADSFIGSPLALYLAFGVATALAVALAGWVPALVYVQRHYQDRLGLSIGIVSSGVGVGMLAVVPFSQLLIDAFGWRAAFQGLGLLSAAWIVPSSLGLARENRGHAGNRGQSPISARLSVHRVPPGKSGSDPDFQMPPRKSGSDPDFPGKTGSDPDFSLRQAMRTEPFWLLVAAFVFGNFCSQTMHVHQVAYLVDHGLAAMAAASVVSVVGLASIAGKIGGGWLSDRMDRELVYIGGIAIMVSSVLALLALGAAPTRLGAYGYAVLLGVGYSATASLIPAMVSDRYSGAHFGAIIGAGLVGGAIGSSLGPWTAGKLYDATGSYALPFLVAVACGLVAGAAGWRARLLRLRNGPRAVGTFPYGSARL